MDGRLQHSFFSLGVHSKSSVCVWRCMWEIVWVCLRASVVKTERQYPWLMLGLHVKLKLAPPEQCNTLCLMTTTCPTMTTRRAPIPINPYFPLYSAQLLSFLPKQEQVFVLLYRISAISKSEVKIREKIFLQGEQGEGGWEWERADDISLTEAWWNQ